MVAMRLEYRVPRQIMALAIVIGPLEAKVILPSCIRAQNVTLAGQEAEGRLWGSASGGSEALLASMI